MHPMVDDAESVALRERFRRLAYGLEAVGGLLKEAAERLADTAEEDYEDDPDVYGDLYGGMDPSDFQRSLERDVWLPEDWWESPYLPHGLLAVTCLSIGQAVFEGFVHDVLVKLSSLRGLPPVPPRLGLQAALRELNKRFGVSFDVADSELLNEFARTRNLWTHNGGVVTEDHVKESTRAFGIGDIRTVSNREVEHALWFFDDTARKILDQAVGPAWLRAGKRKEP